MNNPFETIDARLSNIETLLLDIKHTPKDTGNHHEADELLTVQDTAKFLSLSVPTIYGLTQSAEIPVCKRGKRLYFSKQELTNWIKAGRKKTLAETASEANQYISNKKGLNNGK